MKPDLYIQKSYVFLRENWAHLAIWGVFFALYFPVLAILYTARWKMIDYEHAYFILPISVYLAWRVRGELSKVHKENVGTVVFTLSCVLLGFSVAMYVFGWKWDYMLISAVSFIPASVSLTGLFYGWQVVKKLWFSFFYLIFMIPPPAAVLDGITRPMRVVSSKIAFLMLKAAGYNPTVEGFIIKIGDFSALVGAECSGFRSFITLTALGLLYIYMYAREERLSYKAVLLGLIPVLAIIGNSLRICLISLLGYYFGEKVASGPLHYGSGYLVYVFMIIGLFLADRLMGKLLPAKKQF